MPRNADAYYQTQSDSWTVGYQDGRIECYRAGEYEVDFNSGDLIQCYDCAPEKGTPNHLRSSCGTNPTTILRPDFDAQQTADFPFLGSMVNEVAPSHDWIINEIVFTPCGSGYHPLV